MILRTLDLVSEGWGAQVWLIVEDYGLGSLGLKLTVLPCIGLTRGSFWKNPQRSNPLPQSLS